MRKTLVLSLFLAAGAFALLLTTPSPSQDLDSPGLDGGADVELFDAGDDAGLFDEDAGYDDDAGEEDGGLDDLIDAGFDPYVDAGPDAIPLPEDEEPPPPDRFAPPMQQPDMEPR